MGAEETPMKDVSVHPMSALVLAVGLALGGSSCSTLSTLFPSKVYEHPLVTVESPDSAEVFMIRPYEWAGRWFRTTLVLEGEKLLKVRDGTYCRYHIAPGAYSVRMYIYGMLRAEMFLRLEAGNTYNVLFRPPSLDQFGGPPFLLTSAEHAAREISKCRLLNE